MLTVSLLGGGDEPRFMKTLRQIIGVDPANLSMIDLCSHIAPLTQKLGFRDATFMDANDHSAHIRKGQFFTGDVLGIHPIFEKHYDVALCLDGIEHMHKPQGRMLLNRMESIASKAILFTPLGEWMVDPTSTDPESHKCGWYPEELNGWASIAYPEWHTTLGIGAFFFWKCENLEAEFERVKNALTS